MRIGLDGAYALSVDGGNGRLINEGEASAGRRRLVADVIERIATDYPGSELSVYTAKVGRKSRLALIEELHNVEYRLPAPSGFQGRMWRLFGITNCLQPDRIDLYHGLNGELPLNIAASHVPTVVSVGPDELKVLNGTGSWPLRQLRQYVAVESLRNATRVTADSEATKATLAEGYGIPSGKIDVIPAGEMSGAALMAVYERALSTML